MNLSSHTPAASALISVDGFCFLRKKQFPNVPVGLGMYPIEIA